MGQTHRITEMGAKVLVEVAPAEAVAPRDAVAGAAAAEEGVLRRGEFEQVAGQHDGSDRATEQVKASETDFMLSEAKMSTSRLARFAPRGLGVGVRGKPEAKS